LAYFQEKTATTLFKKETGLSAICSWSSSLVWGGFHKAINALRLKLAALGCVKIWID
jgi:hypothetical protein